MGTQAEWTRRLPEFLCGLLTIAQLACSMEPVAEKMDKFLKKERQAVVLTDSQRENFTADSTPLRSASSKSTGKRPAPTQQSKSETSDSVEEQLKDAMELNASSVRFVFDGRKTLDRGDGVSVFFGRA